MARQARDELVEIFSHQRFAARQTDLFNAQTDKEPGEPLDFLKGQNLADASIHLYSSNGMQ